MKPNEINMLDRVVRSEGGRIRCDFNSLRRWVRKPVQQGVRDTMNSGFKVLQGEDVSVGRRSIVNLAATLRDARG